MLRAVALRWLQAAPRISSTTRSVSRQPARLLSTSVVTAAAAEQPNRQTYGRPSKTAAKQEAKQFQDVARQLSRLTERQLARLAPLVGDDVVDAAALAARISHRNQGRQRQESLVARRLREAADAGEARLDQLQAAIESVRTGQGVIANPGVERQLELWLQALLGGDAAAATLVFGLAQQQGAADPQELRQLLRQAQQTEAPPADSSSSDELAAAAAAAAALAPPRPTAKALAARRQLRKLLQPLAEAQLAAEESDE